MNLRSLKLIPVLVALVLSLPSPTLAQTTTAATFGDVIRLQSGTPSDIVTILSAAINRGLAAPEVQEKSRKFGMDAHGTSPQEMHDRMARDIAKWRAVIEKANIPKQ